MAQTVILLLAAGKSSRMRGADKLLEPVAGEPLLRRQARAAVATGAPVLVALPAAAGRRDTALKGLALDILRVADAALGMGHSIAAGARAAQRRGASGLMVVNADLPGIGTAELLRLLAAAGGVPDRILRGMDAQERPGHPVLFPARLIGALAGLTGDAGAKELVAAEPLVMVPLPGDAATRDLDTPEDWGRWRAETGL